MGIRPLSWLDELTRMRLGTLDRLLDQLEELNLAEASHLPMSLVHELDDAGIDHAKANSVTEVIDLVFDLQEPLLRTIASAIRSPEG